MIGCSKVPIGLIGCSKCSLRPSFEFGLVSALTSWSIALVAECSPRWWFTSDRLFRLITGWVAPPLCELQRWTVRGVKKAARRKPESTRKCFRLPIVTRRSTSGNKRWRLCSATSSSASAKQSGNCSEMIQERCRGPHGRTVARTRRRRLRSIT